MSTFLDRILFGGQVRSTGEHRRIENPDLAIKTHWNTMIAAQPVVAIGIYDGMVSYEDQQPLIAPDGGIIPEEPPGHWAQLYRAGRLYGR